MGVVLIGYVGSLVMCRNVRWGVGRIVLIMLVCRIHGRIVRTVLILLRGWMNSLTVLTVHPAVMMAEVGKWLDLHRRVLIIRVWLAHGLVGLRVELHHQHLLRESVHD